MKILSTFILLLYCISGFSSEPNSDAILREGQLMYRLEKASWYGTDDFLQRFPAQRDIIGGYLSYETDMHKIFTIFFERENPQKILARYQYDSLPKQAFVSIDTLNEVPNSFESDLIKIRQDALKRLTDNKDEFFSFYNNTSFNLVPLINSKERKVYVLTGPQTGDVVLIGNDYVLRYDPKNNFKGKAKIHNSLIQLPYKLDKGNSAASTMHTHIVSEVIDPTDICTILLYKEYVEWKHHYVISSKYVSVFDVEKEILVIMTRKAWEKIRSACIHRIGKIGYDQFAVEMAENKRQTIKRK